MTHDRIDPQTGWPELKISTLQWPDAWPQAGKLP